MTAPSEKVTDFSQYSLAQLTAMLYASDPATGTTTAQTWDATGKMLHEQASNLEGRLRSFDGEWQGTASDEYKRMVTDLIGGLRKVAETSLQMRDLTYDAVDSLVAARAAMPAAVDVPVVPPTTLALATTPLSIDATTSPAAAAQMQSDQAKAVAAVQAQQSAISASNAAHAQAVAVMNTLADSYVVAQDRFPPTPGGATPTVNGTGPGNGLSTDATPVVLDANGVPVLLQNATQNQTPGGPNTPGQPDQASQSLFGDMFTVGLAAAAAAAGGKFATTTGLVGGTTGAAGMPIGNTTGSGQQNTPITGRLTPVANPNSTKNDANKGAAADAAGVLGSRYLASKLGGKFGGGGGGSIGGIGGADPSAAKAAADAAKNFTAAETGAVANDFAGGALGAGGAAAAAASRGGMMPMMPMSGMAGAGMGGDANRRIPAWLVETEDVWGASAPVSPGVIGGDL
ncbi:hypothetical protein ABH926_002858 [Catenulispora sp. GP43]|uniref:WXG100 family type VII secretion target n=1 Tax=Catenulispora sp. GP43 TaxID=3156263 RepID=UPI0035161979